MMNRKAHCLLVVILLFISCGKGAPEPIHKEDAGTSEIKEPKAIEGKQADLRPGFEMVEDVGLVRVPFREFEKLPLKTKKLIYHNSQAAQFGDAIYYGQLGSMHLTIKKMLEGIVAAGDRVSRSLRDKLYPYAKLFWVNHGNHDALTGKKNLPMFIPGELAAAAQISIENGIDIGAADFNGVKLGANQLEQIEALLKAISPWLFDRSFMPSRINKSPPDGGDVITASANNLYQSVTLADLEGFEERYPLNSRLTKANGTVVEQVYRSGKEGIEPGLFAKELAEVVRHLKNGLPLLKPAEKQAMGFLIDFFETGESASLNEYTKLWMKLKLPVETTIGFYEQNIDPRGKKGVFGAHVMVRDNALHDLMRKVKELAAYYEQHLPLSRQAGWPEISPHELNLFQVVSATGASGPVSRSEIDWPGSHAIRKKYRSRKLYLTNILDALDNVSGPVLIHEFSISQEVAMRREKHRQSGRVALMLLREVIGRGFSKMSATLAGRLKNPDESSNFAEELRADLIALYLVFDPKNREIGLVPSSECAQAIYDDYASSMLEQLGQLGDATTLTRPRMQARQVIVRYAMEKGAVEVIRNQRHFFARVVDYQVMRDALGELLAEVHRAMSVGDALALKQLIMEYGTSIPVNWTEDVASRFKRIVRPRFVAFVYPLVKPHLDKNSEILDIKLVYPQTIPFSDSKDF